MEGVLIASGAGVRSGAKPEGATLLDVAPTILHLLGVPVPVEMDGRPLDELFDPAVVPASGSAPGGALDPVRLGGDAPPAYSEEEDAAIQQRLADLGYL